VGISKGSRN